MTENVFVSPWRWSPLGGRSLYGKRPEVGQLVAWDHTAWRVLSVDDVPRELWSEKDRAAIEGYSEAWLDRTPDARPYSVRLRPAAIDVPWTAINEDIGLRCTAGMRAHWDALPEHYPVCQTCGELMPCREVVAEETAKRAIKRLGRYEVAGVCPACEEPVTARQKSLTFTDNLEIPGGPPLTFHLRGRCRYDASEYEKRWVAADPERRRATLSCSGHVTNHNDGTYDCTALGDCPGPRARHQSYSCCRCPDCHARGRFGCNPPPGARRNGAPPDASALFDVDSHPSPPPPGVCTRPPRGEEGVGR